MKIAITGHSRGIGKSLAEHFAQDHEVIGFSRSNGYDIAQPGDRRRIIDQVTDADVFINNAHSGFHQIELLWELYSDWTSLRRNATIISISARISPSVARPRTMMHGFQKLNLQDLSRTLSLTEPVCVKVGYVSFGPVDTEQTRKQNPYHPSLIPLAHVNAVIDWMMHQPSFVFIAELAVYDYPEG